jgi:NAD(P)-dependent dehydrogenase (short-subunit alcohol dehydrogenase family)
VSHQQILAFAAQRLAPHKRPRIIETVDAIPRTAAGKVIRHELPLASLRGRTVVITGGTRGSGHVLAGHFARQRARVIITGRSGTVLTAAEELACHGDVRGFVSDIADLRASAILSAGSNRITAASAFWSTMPLFTGHRVKPGTPTPMTGRTRSMSTSLACSACAGPSSRACTRGHGRIVNIVSNAGKHRWPHMSAYSVSKAAVIKLTDQAARNLLLLAAGMADTRPGQYLTVHDDFTAS